MEAIWKPISKLRVIEEDISGWSYSAEYVKSHSFDAKAQSWSYENNEVSSEWIPEPIQVKIDDTDNIVYSLVHADGWYEPEKERFKTSAGLFVSHNNGEFGGTLESPGGEISGNFVEVFEVNGITYAIDSCNHMGMGHFKLYRFDEDLKPNVIFESKEWGTTDITELISFKALFISNSSAFILASGVAGLSGASWKDYCPKSYLLQIIGKEFSVRKEIPKHFDWVRNMVITDNHMILGMDKVVVDADLESGDTIIYTPLSKGAEEDLIKKKSMW